MNITEQSAEQFAKSMAAIGGAMERIMAGGVGDVVKEAVAKRGEGEASTEWALGIVSDCLPRVMQENMGDLYAILGALDGQTAEEYAADRTVKDVLADVAEVKREFSEGGEARELLGGFFG